MAIQRGELSSIKNTASGFTFPVRFLFLCGPLLVFVISASILRIPYGIAGFIIMAVSFCISLVLLKRTFSSWLLFLPALLNAYIVYSVLAVVYWFPDDGLLWTSLSGTRYSFEGAIATFVFQVTLLTLVSSCRPKKVDIDISDIGSAPMLSVVLLLICLVLGFVLYGQADSSNIRIGGGVFYEYLLIPIIIAICYLPKERSYRIFALSIVSLLFVNSLVHGNRAESLPILMATFIVLFSDKVTPLRALPIILIGVLVMQAIGIFRLEEYRSNNLLEAFFNYLNQTRFAWDTAYSSYHTSLTFIASLDCTDVTTRLQMFGTFWLSMLAGGSVNTSGNLAVYTSAMFVHYNGGYLPIYFYFYIGYIGCMFAAVVVALYFRMIDRAANRRRCLTYMLGVYISCASFRWFLYSPSQLFRGALLFCIFYMLIKFVHNTIQQKKRGQR